MCVFFIKITTSSLLGIPELTTRGQSHLRAVDSNTHSHGTFFSKGISEHRDTNVTVFDRETTEKLWQIAQTRALDEVLFIKYVVLYKAYESVFEVLSVSVCRQKKEPSKKIVDRLRKHLATFYCHLSDFDF